MSFLNSFVESHSCVLLLRKSQFQVAFQKDNKAAMRSRRG